LVGDPVHERGRPAVLALALLEWIVWALAMLACTDCNKLNRN
jgi:hypothetical protein